MAALTDFEEHVLELELPDRRLVFIDRVVPIAPSDYIQLTQDMSIGSHSGQPTGSSSAAIVIDPVGSPSGPFYTIGIAFKQGYLFYTAENADQLRVGRMYPNNVIIVSLGGRR